MRKISVAIVGWGNVGRACKRAISECPVKQIPSGDIEALVIIAPA